MVGGDTEFHVQGLGKEFVSSDLGQALKEYLDRKIGAENFAAKISDGISPRSLPEKNAGKNPELKF